MKLDVLTLTAIEAQQLLDNGKTTSEELVEAYLIQIATHNHSGLSLNALISITPRDILLSAARTLDAERASGHVRGPLHGVPFIFKDVFPTTGLGLPTTGGAPAFRSGKVRRMAPLLQHLLDECGMIPLGTANLTELCGMKDESTAPGWSPLGGQTQSPFVFGGLEADDGFAGNSSIAGSSAGTAAAVAAGFAPLGIGTECCGSLVFPASRGGLYGLKCGLGAVDVEAAWRFTETIDFVGGMAKTVGDLNLFVAAMTKRADAFELMQGRLDGLRVGALDEKVWRLGDAMVRHTDDTRKQMANAYGDALTKIKNAGAEVFEKVELTTDVNVNDKSPIMVIGFYEASKTGLPRFISEFKECDIASAADMVKYNNDNADVCLPPGHDKQGQIELLADNKTTEEEYQTMLSCMRDLSKRHFEPLFEKMDIVVALTESSFAEWATMAGYPIATMPLGMLEYSDSNSRPFGLTACAPRGQEGLLLRFMAGWEKLAPPRASPRPLVEWGQEGQRV